MKLKNKKTGEIGYFCFANWDSPVLIIMDKNGVQLAKYNSLAELNEEWEDAPEEPKEYWYIDWNGEVCRSDINDERTEQMKLIGNYFDTREEAEKAVEKLKAWKRLRDKGFRFHGWNGTEIGSNISYISEFYYEGCADDMDLLFGGEECVKKKN